MIKGLYTSATGMKAQEMMVDNIANNLANVNTTGYKRSMLNFQDLIYVNLREAGTDAAQGVQVPTGLEIGSGVRPASTAKIFSIGTLENTSSELDVAIEGDGFFKVTMPNGDSRYTRDGALRVNAEGQLVTSDGFFIDPQITIPTNTLSLSIGSDGTISVVTGDSPNTAQQVGSLTLTMFANPAGLSAEGRNLFAETVASGSPNDVTPGEDGSGMLLQGFLERSNVEVVTELVNLILAQRAYEVNSRTIRIGDEMLSIANNVTR